MADFSEITQEINEHINTNGQRAITGAKLNEVLRDMISTVNEKKQDTLTIDSTPTEGSTNPVQSGGVEEALGSLYQALSVAENCLFGGLVTRLESPSQGDDHRYYYITQQGGYFSHFDVTIPNDTHMATMIYWSDILSRWVTIGLWPTMTYVDAKANKVSDATQGNLAGLDSDGNLTDSGIASSEVATQSDISGFITNTVNNLTNYYLKSETYTQAEINALIGAIQQFHYEIYATLPQTGQSNVLYLIGPTGSGSDKYEEYVYSNSVFTKIGDTSIDLSGYVTTSALNTALADYTTTANLTTLLSDKADKCIPSTTGNIAKLTAQGNLADGGVLAADVATVMQLEYKADRVNNATNGNLAGLDSNGNLTDSGFSPSDFLETTVNTTYSELVALKNNGNLIPGAQYRITDYTCTTTQVNTQSAGNAFDIIVTADSETELNENARATHHNGDTYFQNCNLDAWELKYCLENDTNRFAWADSTNGKGVIYYMKDEWNNECPYDFKNILTTYGGGANYYTFDALVNSVHYDLTVAQTSRNCYGNTIGVYHEYGGTNRLGRNIFGNTSLSSSCHNNSLGESCYNNTFNNGCINNTFRNNCSNNSFGSNCTNNIFGNYCTNNSFGGYCQAITVFDGVQHCGIIGGSSNNLLVKNAQILNGTKGTSSSRLYIEFEKNKDYTQVAGLVNGTEFRIWIAENTVTGPQTSTNNHIAVFDGATGKIVKDGGYAPSDFATANQGALADTAYQKPLTGIPASDLASGVIPTIPVQDVTVGGTSVVTNGVAVVPAIPDISGKEDTSNKVSTISGNETNTTKYPNTKATYDAIHPAYGSSQPQDGMLPNVLYKLGTLSGSVTIAFATPTDNTIENEYKFTFTADSTAPTITWPQSVTSWIGNSLDNGAPKVEASNYYECSVIDGHGIFNKF